MLLVLMSPPDWVGVVISETREAGDDGEVCCSANYGRDHRAIDVGRRRLADGRRDRGFILQRRLGRVRTAEPLEQLLAKCFLNIGDGGRCLILEHRLHLHRIELGEVGLTVEQRRQVLALRQLLEHHDRRGELGRQYIVDDPEDRLNPLVEVDIREIEVIARSREIDRCSAARRVVVDRHLRA